MESIEENVISFVIKGLGRSHNININRVSLWNTCMYIFDYCFYHLECHSIVNFKKYQKLYLLDTIVSGPHSSGY